MRPKRLLDGIIRRVRHRQILHLRKSITELRFAHDLYCTVVFGAVSGSILCEQMTYSTMLRWLQIPHFNIWVFKLCIFCHSKMSANVKFPFNDPDMQNLRPKTSTSHPFPHIDENRYPLYGFKDQKLDDIQDVTYVSDTGPHFDGTEELRRQPKPAFSANVRST